MCSHIFSLSLFTSINTLSLVHLLVDKAIIPKFNAKKLEYFHKGYRQEHNTALKTARNLIKIESASGAPITIKRKWRL
jgi:hypothetical protein